MTANDLIAAFETLADAPDGVKRLRELVLQLAVRGKLVAQDPKDESAELLLRRIAAKRPEPSRGRASSREAPATSTQPEPELPSGWTSAPLGSIAHVIRGITFPASAKNRQPADGLIACLRTTNVQAKLEWDDLLYVAREYVSRADQYLRSDDILMSMANSRELVGKVALNDRSAEGVTFGGFLGVIRPVLVVPRFLMAVLRTPSARESLIDSATQTTNIANISLGRLNPFVVAIPPLAEQHRIVARVDELMSLLDRLEAARTARDDVRRAARDAAIAALRDAEDTDGVEAAWGRIAGQMEALFADPEDVGPLRQAVLGLAIRGRLVPQDPKDEPATKLLQKLARAREARKDALREASASGALGDAVKPFELPAGWSWCRLTDAGELARGRSRHRPRNDAVLYTGGTVPMVQTGDVARARGTVTTYTALYNEVGVEQSRLWPAGTMCITIAANIADTALLGFPACFPDSVVGFRPFPPLRDARYFHIYMRNVQSELEAFAPSTAQKNINLAILDDLFLPLPPLREIEAIVAKVDALMAICDALEARLTAARDLHAQFAAAAVHHLDV